MKPPHEFHFPRKNSEHCLWFLLRLQSSIQCSFISITEFWLAGIELEVCPMCSFLSQNALALSTDQLNGT